MAYQTEDGVLIDERQSISTPEEKYQVRKLMIICSKGTIEDVYAALIMANGAVMEGLEANLFFTFFGLDAITKEQMDHLHTATVGNPAFMRNMPTIMLGLPGMEAFASGMMKKEMEKLDIPPVSEFLDMITAGGGKIYGCKLAVDMFKLKREDLYDDLSGIITVGELYELAGGPGVHFVFV
jgi:peroxiredoxin family protein